MLRLFNTLSRKVEDFKPLNPPQVGFYTCGPTVYDYQHIGNFRTMIFSDLLHRVLLTNDFEVKFIRNITDIDDKIIKNAREKNMPIDEFSKDYTEKFFEDIENLNILPVSQNPKATQHVEKMIKYIEDLIAKGFAYVEKDGSVYFEISKFPDYGKLSGIEKRELKTGTRMLSDEYTKENVQDFALWKSVSTEELVGYDSPWGRGRPGWHIECSVMSQEYLGQTFDLHAGGVDLIFPHHENEIAQAEAKTGQTFVKYFVHGEMLLIDGGKMSKSLKNFYLLKDLTEKGFEPLAYRYLTLTAHYRDKLNFTWESLQSAQNAINNLRVEVRELGPPSVILGSPGSESGVNSATPESAVDAGQANFPEGTRITEFYGKFLEALNNDLNAPQALAVMWQMVKSDLSSAEKSAILLEMDKVLGLKLDEYIGKPIEIPDTVQKLVDQREKAREQKDFQKSDQLRKEISKLGFEVDDTAIGPKMKKF